MEWKLMAVKWLSVTLLIIKILVGDLQVSNGCVEEERLSLLHIKSMFLSYNSSQFFWNNYPFPSWNGTNCCNWDRVQCDTSQAHVVHLLLYGLLDYDENHHLLNLSLFQNFKELKNLDLASNGFVGFTENQGFNHFSSFNKLETLDLSWNYFGKIFSSLSGLTSLKNLWLSYNLLNESIILGLENLRGLDLRHNELNGTLQMQELKNLRVLSLSSNRFNSWLQIQGFCELNSLVELDVSDNYIRGEFPECIGNFTGLKSLNMSDNQLSGEIPSTTISKLTSIEYLSLDGNDFEGTFSFSSLANHSHLSYFKLSGNSNNVGNNIQVETEELHEWQPTFQLETLSLPSCNLNDKVASKIPTFLLTQHKLKNLDLSFNHLVGPFPFWLLQNNSELASLDLSNNLLTGPLQLSTWNRRLRLLELSSNLFSGQLPTNLGFLLQQVEHLNISRNNFEGNLPPSMRQMKMLTWLDVSNNKFSGDLQISTFNNMASLELLLLANNNFSGSIEEEWKNKTWLIALDISNNMISGKLPTWIGSLRGLQSVRMSRNLFEGELPIQICFLSRLIILDVSENQLVGEVPSNCFNSTSLVYLYIQKNGFSGHIPQELIFSTASSLKILDLSYNNFSGHIPKWLHKLTSLRVLLLKGNELDGPIPTQLCQNREISIMDLSNNKLNGMIPSCFNNITFGDIKVQQPNTLDDFSAGWVTTNYTRCGSDFHYTFCSLNQNLPIIQVEVDFTTKYRFESYKGNILNYMSGLDLSSNQLTGDIPRQIGDLVQIHALNFSHNKLTGPIPKVLSNLGQLESLDLSNNFLSGHIPHELATLNFLSTFNVSYNNLSGMIPTAPHFTYPESSFYGNPYLCGLYIEHKCSISLFLPTSNQFVKLEEEDGAFIDLEAFCWSFAASYITLLLGFVVVLYINTQWRQRWFYFIEDCYHYFCKCT